MNAHNHTQIAEHLPYPVRNEINQIEPRLDVFWQERLLEIFQNLTPQARTQATEQLLVPKEIVWDKTGQKFEYRPANPQTDTLNTPLAGAPKPILLLAHFLKESLSTLKTENGAENIAAELENAFNKIAAVKTDNKLQWQVFKHRLQSDYITAAAQIIRSKIEITVPPLRRKLNTPVIKTFINEVFLKQQLLGYTFKTLRNRQLKQMPHELINGYLSEQQQIRQLEIVRASKYLFAIAPSIEISVNPFNLRRFLSEEMLYSQLLLNGVAINTALLANGSQEIRSNFQKQIACLITIESSVSRIIIEFVESLQNYHEDVLLPALFRPLDGNLGLEKAIAKLLKSYETLLTEGILQPLHHTLKNRITHADEHIYLQLAMRQLFGDIIGVFKDFQSLPGIRGSETADIFFGRLVAYAVFLEKRGNQVFVLQEHEDWQQNSKAARQICEQFQALAQNELPAYSSLKQKADEIASQISPNPSFFDKLMKKNEKLTEKMEELRKKARQIQYAVHDKLYHLPADWREQIVNLEFDAQLITGDEKRRYALPDGDNGISRLPLVVQFAENRTQFDLAAFLEQFPE